MKLIKSLLGSKKAMAAMSALMLVLLNPLLKKIGMDLAPEALQEILLIVGAYILGQGIADAGKEAKKLG